MKIWLMRYVVEQIKALHFRMGTWKKKEGDGTEENLQ